MIRIPLMVLLFFFNCGFLYKGWKEIGHARWGVIVSMIGLVSNWIAISVNGWQMPVIGEYYIPDGLIWKIAGPTLHLVWLVDHFSCSFGTFSIGDVFIVCGGVIAVIICAVQVALNR